MNADEKTPEEASPLPGLAAPVPKKPRRILIKENMERMLSGKNENLPKVQETFTCCTFTITVKGNVLTFEKKDHKPFSVKYNTQHAVRIMMGRMKKSKVYARYIIQSALRKNAEKMLA
jgi:hypothetical protein